MRERPRAQPEWIVLSIRLLIALGLLVMAVTAFGWMIR